MFDRNFLDYVFHVYGLVDYDLSVVDEILASGQSAEPVCALVEPHDDVEGAVGGVDWEHLALGAVYLEDSAYDLHLDWAMRRTHGAAYGSAHVAYGELGYAVGLDVLLAVTHIGSCF